MAMLIVSDDEFELEKQKLSGKPSNIKHEIIKKGRGNVNEVPEEIREVIAETSLTQNNNKEVAEAFGVSHQAVSAYKNGATSLATYHKTERVKARNRIADRVHTKLELAIDALTPEKITEIGKATDITAVMKDLAAVTEKLTGRINGDAEDKGKQVHLHLYGPPQKKLESYEVIDVTPE